MAIWHDSSRCMSSPCKSYAVIFFVNQNVMSLIIETFHKWSKDIYCGCFCKYIYCKSLIKVNDQANFETKQDKYYRNNGNFVEIKKALN